MRHQLDFSGEKANKQNGITEKNPKEEEMIIKNNDFHNKYRGVGFVFAKNGYTFKGNMQKGIINLDFF